jgi:hypothetical protein
MHIFKEGRAPFLEFLRNLTPQTVVLSLALIAGHRLRPTCCHMDGAAETMLFVCFLVIWLASVWANSSLFIEKYLVSVKRINRASKLFVRSGFKGLKNFAILLKFTWRNQRLIFIEIIFVFVVVEFGFAAVTMSAVGSATTLLNTFKK